MPTQARVREDGVLIHFHPTTQNPRGRWHGPWTNHGNTSSNDPEAHTRENADNPRWLSYANEAVREQYAGHIRQSSRLPRRNFRTVRFGGRRFNEPYWSPPVVNVHVNSGEQRPGHTDVDTPISEESLLADPTTRRFGVEIECIGPINNLVAAGAAIELDIRTTGYTHQTTPYWKIVGDGSLRYSGSRVGFSTLELVSPILQGDDGRESLKKACEALLVVEAIVNSSCGLHVHHDATHMTLPVMKRLARNYYRAQKAIDKLVSHSRRSAMEAQYCHPIYSGELDQILGATTIGAITGYISRYKTLNLVAYSSHKTVEFRQHQGTTDFKKILNWVEFGQHFIGASERGVIVPDRTESLDDLFSLLDLPVPLAEYLKERSDALTRSILAR